MYTSTNICEFFNISRETVRTWSDEFADWLSPGAKPDKGRMRQFTEDDLRVFSLVSEMKAQGKVYAEIKASLGAGQRGDLPGSSYAIVPGERNRLAELQTRVHDLQAALSDAIQAKQGSDAKVELLTDQLEAARAEITRLVGENAVLRYRLDGK